LLLLLCSFNSSPVVELLSKSIGVQCDRPTSIKLSFYKDVPVLMYPIVEHDVVHIIVVLPLGLYHREGILCKGAALYLHRAADALLVDDYIPRVLMSEGEGYCPAVV